ncbi:protein ImuB [Pacificimonas flava]|nr:protein ImuB [Pacificimonas flava]
MRTADRRPLVLAVQGPHGPIIHDMDRTACRLGLKRGARITDIRALVPNLCVEDADPSAETAALQRLAVWARRWCPWTQTDGADGIFLDISGSAHLAGGEGALLREMREAFGRAGLRIRAAAAATPGAAWALARYGGRRLLLCRDEQTQDCLAPLPAASLRLHPDTVLLLERLGLKTIGALAAIPREALVRRFRRAETPDANPVLRLDQAMGRLAEPLVPGRPAPPLRAARRLAEPIGDLAGIENVLGDLMLDLTGRLGTAARGARHLRLTGYRTDGGTAWLEARTSTPSRDPAHLTRLFAEDLPRLDPGFGFDAMTLEAAAHEALSAHQGGLAGEDRAESALTTLLDRLMARLGSANVSRLRPRGSHVPERAETREEVQAPISTPSESASLSRHRPPRPPRLLSRPEEAEVLYALPEGPPARLAWRRQSHRIVRSEGPERIAPEWWREKSTVRLRDYYLVEDEGGRRFWLFREGVPGDGRGGAPRWFVQGLFG